MMLFKINFNSLKNKLIFVLKVILVFFIIYDIQVISLGSITSARAVCILFFTYIIFFKRLQTPKHLLSFVSICLFLICVALTQSSFSGDYTQVSRLFYFLIYSVITSYCFSKIILCELEMYWVFLIACTIQAIILLLSFFDFGFKANLATYVVYGGNFEVEYNIYRAFGLSSTTGAALSLIQSIGVISSVQIINKSTVYRYKIAAFVIGFICFCSTLFVGRTGVLISVVIYLFFVFNSGILNIIKYVPIIGIIIFFVYNWFSFESFFGGLDNFSTEYFFDWLGNAFSLQENKTIETLDDMKVPSITYETVIGTGQIIAPNGTNASGNDSGYIHTYYSLGLIFSVVFYTAMFRYLIKLWSGESYLSILLIVLLFVVEYKEPFIFKYAFPFFLFSILYSKNDRKYYGRYT